jgi:hypothetical protein
MYRRDYRDIIAGGLLIAIGVIAAVNANLSYNMGTLRHMGPGMFPAMLGWLLVGLGALVLLPALFRSGTLDKPEIRPLVTVCAAVTVFALTIRNLGIAPSIVATTLTACLADSKLGLIGSAILGVILAVFAVLIFIYGLGMPLQIINWQFR